MENVVSQVELGVLELFFNCCDVPQIFCVTEKWCLVIAVMYCNSVLSTESHPDQVKWQFIVGITLKTPEI